MTLNAEVKDTVNRWRFPGYTAKIRGLTARTAGRMISGTGKCVANPKRFKCHPLI